MFLFSYSSSAVVKDEPPDVWDEEEQQQQLQREEKEILRRKDKDLEFLFQEIVRDGSLDDRLKRDLQSKKSDPKYKEMLVSIMISIKFTAVKVEASSLLGCISLLIMLSHCVRHLVLV